jgi:hypothetical protein
MMHLPRLADDISSIPVLIEIEREKYLPAWWTFTHDVR